MGLAGCSTADQYNPPWMQSPQAAAQAPSGPSAGGAPSAVSSPSPAASPALREPAKPGVIVVRKGESLYQVARRAGVPVQSLIAENSLKKPYALQIDQELKVPPVRAHTVVAGETLTGISNAYGVDMTRLARMNEIPAPYGVRTGQVLAIPNPEPKQPLPDVVRPLVASSPKVPGQDTGKPAATGPAGAVEPSKAAPANPQPSGETSVPGKGSPEVATTAVTAPMPPAARSEPMAEPPKRAGSKFGWPAKGKIIVGFGVSASGLRNDGINIAVAAGSVVRAAENGIVVYAGNELKGFGNLLLIKHADGWMTAYAHNSELAVLRGDVVKKGQAIARAGATGSVTSPQVHFEVRKDGQAVDPAQYMDKR